LPIPYRAAIDLVDQHAEPCRAPCATCHALIDEYEFVAHPRLAGHGPTLFAGLSQHVVVKLVSRLELGSGAVAMRYEPRR
jgi:dihydrofolate reductase